ncbi:unnamed protein product [Cuscuta epithymum]|nr:unnamed protein product [Cuscuta epithymum]
MAKEVYGGKVGDGGLYDRGVHAGSLGLLLNSIVLGFMSLGLELLARRVGRVNKLWAGGNFILAICLGMTVLVTKLAKKSERHDVHGRPLGPTGGIKAGAFIIFSVLGIPQAVTFSIPFALASIFSSNAGAGQGLSLGVLNLAIVIPQMFVSVVAGPWDAMFGGGNLPGFVAGAVASAASGVFAIVMLPSPPPEAKAAAAALPLGGGFH